MECEYTHKDIAEYKLHVYCLEQEDSTIDCEQVVMLLNMAKQKEMPPSLCVVN